MEPGLGWGFRYNEQLAIAALLQWYLGSLGAKGTKTNKIPTWMRRNQSKQVQRIKTVGGGMDRWAKLNLVSLTDGETEIYRDQVLVQGHLPVTCGEGARNYMEDVFRAHASNGYAICHLPGCLSGGGCDRLLVKAH